MKIWVSSLDSVWCSKHSARKRRNSIRMTFVDQLVKMRKETISFVMPARPSLRMEQLSCHWADLHENWCFEANRKCVKEIHVLLKRTKISKTFHEDGWTYMTISRSILPRLRNVSKSVKKIKRGNQSTHFMFNEFFPENLAFYDIMWENVVEPDRRQTKI
jgi:hypothetical protein